MNEHHDDADRLGSSKGVERLEASQEELAGLAQLGRGELVTFRVSMRFVTLVGASF